MKKFISDIGDVKTATVYYLPWIFEDYEIFEYSISNEKWNPDNRFIVGKGQPTFVRKAQNDILTYEWQKEVCLSSDNSSFLQQVLTLGRKLCIDDKYSRSTFGEREINLALKFTQKYGLNCDQLFDLHMKNGDPAPHPHGCSLWNLLKSIQTVYLDWKKMNSISDNYANINEIDLIHASPHSALSSECLFSSKQKKFVTFLSANSLLDIARYQLGVVMSAGVFVRKCANPECCEMIVGGRKDKKTCSDACRKAVSRLSRG